MTLRSVVSHQLTRTTISHAGDRGSIPREEVSIFFLFYWHFSSPVKGGFVEMEKDKAIVFGELWGLFVSVAISMMNNDSPT